MLNRCAFTRRELLTGLCLCFGVFLGQGCASRAERAFEKAALGVEWAGVPGAGSEAIESYSDGGPYTWHEVREVVHRERGFAFSVGSQFMVVLDVDGRVAAKSVVHSHKNTVSLVIRGECLVELEESIRKGIELRDLEGKMDKADSDEALFALMDRAVPLSPVARWPRILASGVVERQIMDLGDMLYEWPFVGLNPPRKLAPVIARVDGVEISWAECKKLARTGGLEGKKVELTGALMRE